MPRSSTTHLGETHHERDTRSLQYGPAGALLRIALEEPIHLVNSRSHGAALGRRALLVRADANLHWAGWKGGRAGKLLLRRAWLPLRRKQVADKWTGRSMSANPVAIAWRRPPIPQKHRSQNARTISSGPGPEIRSECVTWKLAPSPACRLHRQMKLHLPHSDTAAHPAPHKERSDNSRGCRAASGSAQCRVPR